MQKNKQNQNVKKTINQNPNAKNARPECKRKATKTRMQQKQQNQNAKKLQTKIQNDCLQDFQSLAVQKSYNPKP